MRPWWRCGLAKVRVADGTGVKRTQGRLSGPIRAVTRHIVTFVEDQMDSLTDPCTQEEFRIYEGCGSDGFAFHPADEVHFFSEAVSRIDGLRLQQFLSVGLNDFLEQGMEKVNVHDNTLVVGGQGN